MARSLVMCPATESLELIDFVDSPLGVLIHACSRFKPSTALVCGRACAHQDRCDLGTVPSPVEGDGLDPDTELNLDPETEPRPSTHVR